MIGGQKQSEKGILQLSIQEIFNHIEGTKEDRDIQVFASYIEIYNEQVNDLLD